MPLTTYRSKNPQAANAILPAAIPDSRRKARRLYRPLLCKGLRLLCMVISPVDVGGKIERSEFGNGMLHQVASPVSKQPCA